ncbi:reductase [Podila horticola]|nr:reductase [Podila horticola]
MWKYMHTQTRAHGRRVTNVAHLRTLPRHLHSLPVTQEPLTDTLTLVPGGTRGIGLATAKLFALNGSRVVILGRDQDRISKVLATELASPTSSPQHFGFQCDVSNQQDIDRVIKNLISTNLMGTIWLNKAVAKGMMRRRKGAIINISSVVGIQGNIGQSVYSASKSAIIGFSKSLSKELGSRGVTVNVIAPGYIDTDMTSGISEERKKEIISRTSLGRLGQPEDVSEAALFLAQAKFVTGQVLVVDGGLSL